MDTVSERMKTHREKVISEYRRWAKDFEEYKVFDYHDKMRFAQALGAITKRTKAALVRDHLQVIAQEYDITPTAARSLAKEITGRGVDPLTLAALFGTKGRTAADKSAFFTDPTYRAEVLESPQARTFVNEYRLLKEEIVLFNRERQASDWIKKNVTVDS